MAVATLRHAALLAALLVAPRGGRAVALRPRRAALRQQAGAAALALAPWLTPAPTGATAAPYVAGCNERLPRTLVVRSEDVAATAAFFEKALGMATERTSMRVDKHTPASSGAI